MRIASLLVLALLVGCDEQPFPPPPAEATASCVYELTADNQVRTSTLWFNSLDQVIRIDGYEYGDSQSVLSPTYVHYDAEGRVIAQEDSRGTSTWTYSPDQIERTGVAPTIMRLVDGRVVHTEFPTYKAPEARFTRDYAYDGAGHLVQYSGDDPSDTGHYTWKTEYGYDQQGRLIYVKRDNQVPAILTYTDVGSRLTVDIGGGGQDPRHWVFDFDAAHRLVHNEMTSRGGITYVGDYVYSEGTIEQHYGPELGPQAKVSVVATGRCDPPVLRFAPELPFPVSWQAVYTRLSDPIEPYTNGLF